MKSIRSFSYALTVSILTAWLSTGCNPDKQGTNPVETCRITQLTGRSTGGSFTTEYQTTYEYDSQGNLSRTMATSSKRSSAGTFGNQTGTKNTMYTYNADGYVTGAVTDELYQTTTDKVITEKTTTTQSYTYTDGRLSGQITRRVGAYGITTITTYLFTYDGSGNLSTKTAASLSVVHDPAIAKELPSGTGESSQTWTYRNNQLVDYVQKAGATESRPTMIQNGLVTKFMLPGNTGDYVVTYTYDDQQRLIASQETIGGQDTHSYTQTWSNAKPAEATLPLFKGWPTTAPEYGRGGVLLTLKDLYYNTVSGKTETFSERTADIKTNSQGFVNSAVSTVKTGSSSAQNSTETYTYSGCQ